MMDESANRLQTLRGLYMGPSVLRKNENSEEMIAMNRNPMTDRMIFTVSVSKQVLYAAKHKTDIWWGEMYMKI